MRFKCININCSPVLPHFVHHIQSQHNRNIQLNKLHGQIQISLYICRIQYINNPAWFFLNQKFSCNYFFAGIRRKRINSRKVCDSHLWMIFYCSVFSVYCHSGKITHMLIGTCKLIKQRSFSTVLISCQRKGNSFSFRNFQSLLFRFI